DLLLAGLDALAKLLEGGNGRGRQVPIPAVDRLEMIDDGPGVLGEGVLELTDAVRQRGHALLGAPLDGFEGPGNPVELDRQRLLEGRLLALQQLDAVLEELHRVLPGGVSETAVEQVDDGLLPVLDDAPRSVRLGPNAV